MQEMFLQGILVLGSHNTTTAHDDYAIRDVADAYSYALAKVQEVEAKQTYS
jgi:hypothetical protein